MIKIAIASGKGGTGKTLVSVNLAQYMSESTPVALVDLDVEEPNDFLFIKGQSEKVTEVFKAIPSWDEKNCVLCGKCSTVCNFHAILNIGKSVIVFEELCHSCYACSELCPNNALPMKNKKRGEIKQFNDNNLTFIEGRLIVGEEQSAPFIKQVNEYVSKNHNSIPYIIMDCPPGTSCPVIASVKDADLVILVTEPTPFGLNDLKLAVETMLQLQKKVGVIINRYGIGNNDVEDYCIDENIPVIAKIPYDKTIATLYSEGKLIFNVHRNFRETLEKILSFINSHKK